jgi:integrase
LSNSGSAVSARPEPRHAESFSAKHPWMIDCVYEDNKWTIRTENPNERRDAACQIDFNTSVGYGGLLLTGCAEDLETVKRYIIRALSADRGWMTSVHSVHKEVLALLNIIRWRRDRGARVMGELTGPWISEFLTTVGRDGLVGLLDVDARVARFRNDIQSDAVDVTSFVGRSGQLLHARINTYLGFGNSYRFARHVDKGLKDISRQVSAGEVRPGAVFRKKSRNRSSVIAKPWPVMLSRYSIAIYGRVWSRLAECTDVLEHDPFSCEVRAKILEHMRSVRVGLRSAGRTLTAPPYQTAFLIDRALRWVLVYAPDILKLRDLLQEEDELRRSWHQTEAIKIVGRAFSRFQPADIDKGGASAPWPLHDRYTPCERYGRRKDHYYPREVITQLLPAACIIVIAAFCARRASEIQSLRVGCVTESEGEIWLSCYNVKSLRRTVRIPAPLSVRRAIEVLERISEPSRSRLGEDWLINIDEVLSSEGSLEGRSAGRDLGSRLTRFAEMTGVPAMPDGSAWEFKPHQFRRFFAVTYFYRFKYRSLTALSEFMQHCDPDVTRAYVTEASSGAFLRISRGSEHTQRVASSDKSRFEDFKLGGREFRLDRLRAVATGQESIGGFGGLAIKAELDRMLAEAQSAIEIHANTDGDDVTLDRVVSALADKIDLDPNPMGHSYCKCTKSVRDTASAGCANAAIAAGEATPRGKVIGFASDMTCSACPHNVQFEENEQYWIQLLTALEADHGDRGSVLSLVRQHRLNAARQHLTRCFGWQPFGEKP